MARRLRSLRNSESTIRCRKYSRSLAPGSVILASLIFEPVAVTFQFLLGDVLAADAGGHPGTETGGRDGQMADAEAVRIMDGAEAQARGVHLVGPLGKAILISSNVHDMPLYYEYFNDAEARIAALDGTNIARRKIGAGG